MKFQWKQNSLALIAALIWGTAFVAQDLCAGFLSPFAFNALRSGVAVVVLGITPGLRWQNGVSASSHTASVEDQSLPSLPG